MIDAIIQPLQIDLAVPTDEQIAEGANALQVNITFGAALPFGQPGQPPIALPLGVLRVPIIREQALSLGDKLKEEGERLPKPSALITANSLEGVDKVANFTDGLRGKN